jgi:hypothetical protein
MRLAWDRIIRAVLCLCFSGADISSPTGGVLPERILRCAISGSIGCDTQVASSVKANLLDDGVVDTLVSVGATSGVHTCISINASDSA